MIDWDFEARLIDRIAVREAAHKALSPRERRVMSWHFRDHETLREVGEREGTGPAFIGQIVNRSIRKMRGRLRDQPVAKPATPQQTVRATPPPGFDRAGFLRHMRGLIARRENEARDTFAHERAELEYLIARETPKPPPPPPKPQPEVPVVWQHWFPPKVQPQVQAVEPWFDPAQTPTIEGMREIARYAVGFFEAMRRSHATGIWTVISTARFVCRRDADAIATALSCIARDLPVPAYQLPEMVEPLAAEAAAGLAVVRVVSANNCRDVAVHIKWHTIE